MQFWTAHETPRHYSKPAHGRIEKRSRVCIRLVDERRDGYKNRWQAIKLATYAIVFGGLQPASFRRQI